MEKHREVEVKMEANFLFPDIEKERGEIERVAEKYKPENVTEFVNEFYRKAKEAQLIDLTEDLWSVLDNTDSYDISRDGWEKVDEHVEHTNNETGSSRDWNDLRKKMEQGQELDAPIILRYKGELHKVSGNTRLMVTRALGVTPKVLLIEM